MTIQARMASLLANLEEATFSDKKAMVRRDIKRAGAVSKLTGTAQRMDDSGAHAWAERMRKSAGKLSGRIHPRLKKKWGIE